MAAGLTPSGLVDQAIAATGLDDLGSSNFERYLESWCEDLEADRLSDAGRRALAKQAERNLETRLRLTDALERHPEIADVELPPIVRIMGFPRSGTTLLHNLMALHPRARSLLRWELLMPVPAPEAASYASDPRIDRVQSAVERLRGTELERMHLVEATDPEECTWGFYDLSGLLGRGCIPLMAAWTDELLRGDPPKRETYEEYRRLVQLLLWRNPAPEDGILVLKCPSDNAEALTFLEVFPEAKLLLCHRDPLRTVTSACRIQEVSHAPFLAGGSLLAHDGAVDAQMLRQHVAAADGLLAAVAARPDRVESILYADLMKAPGEAVCAAFEALDLPVDRRRMIAAVAAFIAEQRAGRRAPPPSAYGMYGYAADQIRGEPAIARYLETFSVPPEETRVADTGKG